MEIQSFRKKQLQKELLKKISPIFFVVLITTSIYQIYIEYNLEKATVKNELLMIQNLFEQTLTKSLWDVNKSQVVESCKGINQSRSVIGLTITSGNEIIYNSYSNEKNAKGVFVHQFDLVHKRMISNQKEEHIVGHAKIYSSFAIVLKHLRISIFIIIGNVALLSAVLFFFFINSFKEIIAGPLEKLASAVSRIDLNDDGKKKIELHHTGNNEISLLERMINMMLEKISFSQKSLSNLNQNLETEVKKRTRELKIAKESAETASRSKSIFLANMSHELRTPLNAILGYSQILKRWTSDNVKVVEGLDIIHRSGDHLLTLINDVLDQSKIEAGKLELNPAAFGLEDFLHQIIGIVRERAEAKELSLSYEPLTDLPARVQADETRLRQVLLNLLGNAIKFTGQGKVTLTAEIVAEQKSSIQAEVCLRFGVEDTGAGISVEDLATIFKPFEQVGEPVKQTEGTGLGLTISRQIVELMGGELKVESTVGQGSRFWFDVLLPKVEAEASTIPMAHLIEGYDGPRRRVLVVDDKLNNRQMLGTLLESLGFKVRYAVDGRNAVEQALAQRPDVILMDLLMPVMTGFEAVKEMRLQEALEGVVVIAVSASVLGEEQEQSLVAGCNAFLPKPVQARDLYALLAEYLDLRWQYADTAKKDLAPSGPLVIPTEKILLTLGELTELYDYEGLETELSRLEQEDVQYKPFVHKIRDWARVFDMQSIRGFFQENDDHRT